MITEDYVSCEIAKLLKEKGFDEGCFKYAINDEIYNKGDYVICSTEDVIVGIPTTQMAMKWLREVKELIITIDYDEYKLLDDKKLVGYSYSIQKPSNPSAYLKIGKSIHVTYERAVDEAIKDCLTNLI